MDRPTANTATGRLFFHAIITIFDFVNILPFGNTKSKLVLNGEDLVSNHLAPDNDRVYFGIACEDEKTTSTNNIIKDVVACPN